MMDDEIRVYEGEQPYIFVSYCHEDKEWVYPLICLLLNKGYRLWFDKGINPGTNWPDIIATHLENSYVVLAILSNESLKSHNCRREFNFAMMENKRTISLVLKDVELTPGMKMQMSTIQAIYFDDLESTELLGEKLAEIDFFNECKEKKAIGTQAKKRFCLRRGLNDEMIEISHNEFSIGRKKEKCDYAIEDNMTISKVHARIYIDENSCEIIDYNSTNGVYVNDNKIISGKKHKLMPGDLIEMGSEKFYYWEIKEEK